MIALVVVGALATTYGILSARRHVDRARVTGRVAQVVIDSGIGDVTVLGSNRTDVVVTHRYHYVFGRPSLGRRLANAKLQLSSRCPRLDVACTVSTRILVPEGTQLVVRVKAGGVDVRRLYGPIDVRTHGGSIVITDSTGPVTARSGTGLVKLKHARGTATLRTDKGDVVLDDVLARSRITVQEGDIRGTCLAGGELDGFVESGIVTVSFTGTPARVRVRTRVGGVALHVPSGAYAIHAGAEKGRVRVTGVRRDPAALGRLDVRAGAGDVVIGGGTPTSAREVSRLRCGSGAGRPRG